MTDDELRQADLSNLSVRQMTPAQRAELRRRYDAFVAKFGPPAEAKTKPQAAKAKARAPKGKLKKWAPAKKPG